LSKKYGIKKKLSLKENLKLALPLMYDDFFRFKDTVVNYPFRKTQLHEMRKAGKPLRYAMELGEYCFKPGFNGCLDEIKEALDLMGDIHDADVMIPDITMHMREIRAFNRTIGDTAERISTAPLRGNLQELRRQRKQLYEDLCKLLELWAGSNFRQKIITAAE
jgi:CHAD domain-containing protein